MNDVTKPPGEVIPFIVVNNVTGLIFQEKGPGVRAVVGVVCCLSIIGSLLIILSYIAQRNRTKTREILVHISFMDLGVSLSNLIGLSVYFDRFYDDRFYDNTPKYIDNMCKTQAFFAAYCTLGSIFWTTALAGYLYIVILHHRDPKYSLYFARFCYFICYGLALGISIWLVVRGNLGYSPYDSSGWCTMVVKNFVTGESDLFISVFGYDLWVYLSILLIIILYVAIKIYISNQVSA